MSSVFPRFPELKVLGLAVSLLICGSNPAFALRILLTNDDGFESHNLQTLFAALKSAGHDVIVSAPFSDQSGTGPRLTDWVDTPPTQAASVSGKIPRGAPGVAPTQVAPDQYYVNSTPATATLYGIDVQARRTWGAPPDLVVSGPNHGNNLSEVTLQSGTVGAAVAALNRGVPAIALSAATGDAERAVHVARLSLAVINAVTKSGKIALPPGVGLNVNLPQIDNERAASNCRFSYTRAEPAGIAKGDPLASLLPSEVQAFQAGNNVTISPIQGTFQASLQGAAAALSVMRELLSNAPSVPNPKFTNLSVRGFVGPGDAAQVLGFSVSGDTAKTVLIRASGPSLTAFSIAAPLLDPSLAVFDGSHRMVGMNDNWCDDASEGLAIESAVLKVGAFPWARDSRDAALIITLRPGLYSIVVTGVREAQGVTLAEVYDLGVD